ncbi:MAG: beta family protein [Parachlamydiales bacterium]
MSANYLPVIKAKLGELKALSNAKKSHLRKMLPLFEVGRIGESIRNAARFKDSDALTCDYLDEIAEKIAEVRVGQSALVDAFQWPADATTETGEHVLPYVYEKLESLGVDVIPVVGYDRWDSQPYRLALQGLDLSDDKYFCLRLDSHAIEDSADPTFFEDQVLGILDDLSLKAGRCAILVDFGDITGTSLEDLIDQTSGIVDLLGPMGFRFFATAGCSLPATIDGAVKKQNTTGKVIRKEMLLWQTLRTEYPQIKWLFGDYGVRGPNTAEDVISPHTNGKIRHTISQHFFIARGHSIQTGDKGAQMHKLAQVIVQSQHYLGDGFSWGDARILACSQGEFKGNSTDWIAIDTNHHIAYVVAEIGEFETTIAAPTRVSRILCKRDFA